MTRITSAMGILAFIITCAVAAPQEFFIDPTRIYTPDDLNELRIAAAYEKCAKTPGCDTSIFSYSEPRAKCEEGAGSRAMVEDMVGVRIGGGNCNSLNGEVKWPSTGQCVALLTQGPCPPSYWVKLSTPDMQPVCAPQPCGLQEPGVMVNGQCRDPQNLPPSTCPFSQQLFTNEFGESECDCSPGLVYYGGTKICYTPYTQGPCTRGYIIKVVDDGVSGHARCVFNSCPEPEMVRLDSNCEVRDRDTSSFDTTCYHLDAQGPCLSGSLRIDNTLAEPLCINTHSIFSSIGPRCGRGSLRDARGRCRHDLAKVLRDLPPIVTSRPRPLNNRTCPRGQTFMAGICLRLASFF